MSDTNRHDALFRRTFGDAKTAATLIRSHLPPDIGAAIDWPTLKLAPSEFVSDALKDRRNDLLFTVDLGGRPAFVYLLLEHQSRADPMMPFRVLRYLVHARTLPPVIPFVIHHDLTPWAAATRLSEIIDAPDALSEALAPFLPELSLSIDASAPDA